MKLALAIAIACSTLAASQTLSLRNEISPQALQLAKVDYAVMNATPSAHFPSQFPNADAEERLLVHAQSEIDAEADRFSEKGPGANDMRLYYLLRLTRETKRALAAASAVAKPDVHLISRAHICDQLAKTTITFGKFQGWRVFGIGQPCLDLPDNARIQEVIVAQQKLIDELNTDHASSNPAP